MRLEPNEPHSRSDSVNMRTITLIWEDTKLPVLAGEIAEGDVIEFNWFTGEVKRVPAKHTQGSTVWASPGRHPRPTNR
jgi:hypothetical protein